MFKVFAKLFKNLDNHTKTNNFGNKNKKKSQRNMKREKTMKNYEILVALLMIICVMTVVCACGGEKLTASQNNGNLEYSEDVELTLMSFNIRLNTSGDGNNAWPNRKENVINYINGAEFDVMCLQEVVTSQYEDIKAGLDSKYTIIHYERQGAGSEGLAIIYNNETFNLVEQNRFWLSATPEIQSLGWGASYYRICVNLLLEHKATGAKLDVYNVHLDHQVETARINGIDLILERAARRDYPLVLAGDFNCHNTSATHAAANAYLKDCQEESPVTEYGMTYQGFVRYENTDEGNAIDFIFVDEENMTPTFFKIIDEYPSDTEFYSDHFAIRSVVKLIVDERVTKDYEKQEIPSSIERDFVSDKEYTLDMLCCSGDSWSVTTNGAVENGIGTLNALGKYVDYEFYLAEDGVVDLIWNIAANSAITDMSSRLVITIDGIPVNVSGMALSTDYQLLVIEDIKLSAGAHHFTCNVIAAGGVKVEKLAIKSSSVAILRSSFVTGADIYLENDRLYYTLAFENNGFSADEYVFFNDGGIVVEYMKAEENNGTITFTFDFTDREMGSRFNPHALVGGKVYINGANSAGDVRGSKLVFTAEEIAMEGKIFKLFNNYSMPTVDVTDKKYATVKSADMYLEGDRVYYKLVYESLYAPEAFDFFYKETDYVHTSCIVDGLMLTFIFDITDTAHLVPHLRINGSNYGHKNGDVLLTVAKKTIEFNGKNYVFSTWYNMPSVWISSVE